MIEYVGYYLTKPEKQVAVIELSTWLRACTHVCVTTSCLQTFIIKGRIL